MAYPKAALLSLIAACVAAATWLGLESTRVGPAGPVGRRLRQPAGRRLFDTSLPSSEGDYYQWMWGDALDLGDHSLAEADVFQWSDWLSVTGIIADLEAYATDETSARPVELKKVSAGHEPGVPLQFGNIDEAVEYLGKFTTTQPPTIIEKEVEKAVQVHVMDKCPEAAPLSLDTQALVFMALGSALTIFIYVVCRCFTCVFSRICRGRKSDALMDDIQSDEDPEPRRALTGGRDPQPYQQCNFQESELRALLADIEEEDMKALPGLPGSGSSKPSDSALRSEAAQEIERVLNAKSAREIFGSGTESQQRTKYRRLVRLLHPDKKVIAGERASLALRRVVESFTALRAGR